VKLTESRAERISLGGQKQPAISPFCNYIKGLLRSDPQRISQPAEKGKLVRPEA